jgi:hypothetical protein
MTTPTPTPIAPWNSTAGSVERFRIEKWFSGKGLDTLRTYVLPTLAEAAKLGYWPKGTSRKVKAALNKAKVAEKLGRENRGRLEALTNKEGKRLGWDIEIALTYGQYERAHAVKAAAIELRSCVQIDVDQRLIEQAVQWARAFEPIAELVALLDRSRPAPTFVLGTLSPTVYANLSESLGVDFTSIRVPEIKWEWVEYEHEGRKVRYKIGTILWPEGTRHHATRYGVSDANNRQCEACGHAIRNAFNWVPIVAQGPQAPLSLWVGRDCASKLFGVKVDGDAQYRGRGEVTP